MTRILGFAGHSGSGKTALIEALLPLLAERGLRVNVIKHSHHDVPLEPAGKDSARFRAAGAQEVVIASPYRYAIMHELRGRPQPDLREQVARLAPADLTLVEGYKREPIARIEVYRPALGRPPLHAQYPGDFIAVATDARLEVTLPCLPLNEPERVADFVCRHLGLEQLAGEER
ncbi:molybdopterin-guanine dinucleotide biosynthesis protein B [Parapusillimonas granuli]|uniref:Molybdopterin-guanine dinucleotide biosynthesis protein B n=1 Tax=Parapusillimonas granuli TaxID=380911 RepID=A0A853FWK6_9BURK|nr:molybdopterin-guanine dinucleotide biosynthesis protein B [Parapusillimonas granuli]MBB5214876.1 molybdopterin-guanine dinucleotide biosynthesis protein B [Parapusillimonas granuli]MEB2399928.1 molybdopterin-guanine dinucleotide biosynthesis protein B [Alcaligenaceae bacterium]NYT49198.1 molybdopterin-guanine dinucleotide biosynthesis protein B [Parapusillimonas granuli]